MNADPGLLAMTRARSALVLEHPFFGSLALRLRLQADASCRDLWTDGRTLGYNPLYAASLPEEKLVAAQAHEIMHLACGHHVRRGERAEDLWNRACDLAINHILVEAGFSLPEGFAHDPDYADLSVDEIYVLLARLQEDETHGGAAEALETGPGQGSEGSGNDVAQDGAAAEAAAFPEQAGERYPERKDTESKTAVGAATAAQSETRDTARREHTAPFTGEVRDHPGLQGKQRGQRDQARKLAGQEADIALSQALQRALHMGDAPAGFSRLVAERLRPVLNWRELLQRFLENCAVSDHSWSSPNRRYIFQDLYLPSRRAPHIPHVVLAVDASGSVGEADLARFCTELAAVLDAWDTTLTVIFHDSTVQSAHTVTRADLPLSLVPRGGGGTDYRPVCAYLEEQGLAPGCLLWFTDLQCTRFPDEPPFPVLWVSSAEAPAPPFGDLLRLPPLP